MKTILLFLLTTLVAFCQVKPLSKEATKQETMDWIASKFQYNYYNTPFTYNGDELTYKFISYENETITFRNHINWKTGFGPETKYYFYTLYLNKIQKVIFDHKKSHLRLQGNEMTEFKYQNDTALYDFMEICLPSKEGDLLMIFHNASPWLLKSLAEAFEKMVVFNRTEEKK
jgi:hypothetical protein